LMIKAVEDLSRDDPAKCQAGRHSHSEAAPRLTTRRFNPKYSTWSVAHPR
jgi:hypothetical protein